MLEKFDEEALLVLKTLTLLCVEDDRLVQETYSILFEEIVKEVVYAEDGVIGYEKFLNNKIDLIITDHTMPNLNGLDMVEKIREKDSNIPIILVSAIEDIALVSRAINLHINGYIKKPITLEEVLSSFEDSAKIIIANRYLEQKRISKIKTLQSKDEYSRYQEELAFQKELNILRNDFYYKMIKNNGICLIDFTYRPLDTLSGDAYSLRKINDETTFCLLADGMGKGISAAFSSVAVTIFINHLIDQMLKHDSFSFDMLIKESINYIKPILLDEEALAIEYILINPVSQTLEYAKFGMPASLIQKEDGSIDSIKSNNPPVSKYCDIYSIDTYDLNIVTKLLFHSDGLGENGLKNKDGFYSDYIQEDFSKSFTKIDFQNNFQNRISEQEDDITFIFISRLSCVKEFVVKQKFPTRLSSIDEANEWYKKEILKFVDDEIVMNRLEIIITELFMNAYEHGNLQIDAHQKHKLIANDEYIDELLSLEKKCDKEIEITIKKIDYKDSKYLFTTISDEGEGFDTNILATIFRNAKSYNGRGVFMSKKHSSGIYYNDNGTSVLFVNKIT